MASKRLLLQAGALTGALALTVTGCGGGSNSTTSSPSAGGASSAGGTGNAPSREVRNPSTAKGGELRLAANADFDSLDPARTYYGYSINFQRLLTRTLVTFKARPGAAGTELEPDLATAVPQGQENNTVWTYKLKPGLKFEDGTPITSQDIKYGAERIFATDQINGGPTYVICLLTKCDASGASTEYQGPYKDKGGLKSIETPDESTITFRLVKPFADWNYVLTLPGVSPVPQAKDKGANYQSRPVSSGPYKIQTYTPGKSLILDRNPNWDQASDTVRTGLPETVNVSMGASLPDIDQQILDNQQDYFLEDTGVQASTQARLLNRDGTIQGAYQNRASNNNTGYMRYVTIQTKVAPFDNVHCRRAVQYAANKVDLQAARGGPITGGDIADNTFPPSLAGAPQNVQARYPNGADHKGNLEEAKRELAECGQPNGFTTTMATSTTPKSKAVGAATQQALGRVGIKVDVKSFDAAQYYSSVIGSTSNVAKNKLGLADAGWGPDFPTGYGFYSQIVDGRAIKPQGNSNYSELNDPTINQLIDEALVAKSRDEFNAKFQEVDKQVMEAASMVPFVFDRALSVQSDRLKNVYFNQGYGHFDVATMGVQ